MHHFWWVIQGIVVFGTIKSEKGDPIIAILDLRPSEKNLVIDGMQKVTSSYAKGTNPAEFVSDSEVLYLEKNKAISLLRTIGFHSPIELNETSFVGRISYQNQYVNINGKLFSDVVKAKLSDRDSEGNKLTKAQQEYFKDSKVRDESGNLLVVYHGTPNNDFTIINSEYGTYFTNRKIVADGFSNGRRVITAYLNVTSPFIYDAKGSIL